MDRETSLMLSSGVFLTGLMVIAGGWVYGGRLLPERSGANASTYDASTFYVHVGIWLVTLASGIIVIINLRSRRDD